MKKVALLVSCILVIGSLLGGCSSSTSTDTTTTTTAASTTTTASSTTTTTIVPGTLVAISGTLNSGTVASAARISAAGLRTQATAYAAIADDTMVAVSKDTGMIYFPTGETDAAGSFTIPDLPAGESFYLAVLDSGKKLSAPVAFGESGGGAAMAVAPGASDLALGSIVYDSSKDVAAPATPPTSVLDPASTVEAKAGETLVPKGAGTYGKGAEAVFSGAYSSAVADGDKDGLPNPLDADNNGDGIIDEFDGLCTMETLSGASTKLNFSFIFTNLHVQFMNTLSWESCCNVDTTFWMTVGIIAKPGNTITSAYLTGGPIWLANARVGMARAGFVDSADYNAAKDGLWSATSPAYKLWEVTPDPGGTSNFEVFIYHVIPSTEVKAGDTLVFTVNFSDGTSEEVAKMVNYTFADIPKLKNYKFGSGSWSADIPDTYYDDHHKTNIDNAASTEVSLRWYVPNDESGNPISGESYYWEIGCDGGGMAPRTYSQTVFLDSVSVSGGIAEATLDVTPYITTEAFGKLNFLIGIRNMMNDNASQTVNFTKSW